MNSQVVFLFPGQGSQSQGMLSGLLDTEQVIADTFNEASDVLGYDMVELTRHDPQEKLNQTEYTQPALLTASIALFRLWEERNGTQAAYAAGHSLGEYSALVAAGSLSFVDAVALVAFRGRVMTEAVPEGVGRMAVILGLDDAQAESLCREVSTDAEKVWPANYNYPGQLVVAGHAEAVNRMMEQAKCAGARRTLTLPVSAPSHTPLMLAAAEAMETRLKDVEIKRPKVPVWSNASATRLDEPDEIEAALVRQLVSPVRWTEIISSMVKTGVCCGVEMGPGKVLSGIVRRIDRDFTVYPIDTSENLANALKQIEGEDS